MASPQKQSPSEATNAHPRVRLETSMGDIVLELNPEKAPVTVENFLRYVKEGHYDGTIFHRVIANFMIQGGGFTEQMDQKQTHPPIRNEGDNGLLNLRGTVAMARTREVNSATAQFFINVKDNPFLNHGTRDFGYCVFGKVVEGIEVVDKIRQVKTAKPGDVPVEAVVIRSAKMVGGDG